MGLSALLCQLVLWARVVGIVKWESVFEVDLKVVEQDLISFFPIFLLKDEILTPIHISPLMVIIRVCNCLPTIEKLSNLYGDLMC